MKRISVWVCCFLFSGCISVQTMSDLLPATQGQGSRLTRIDRVRTGMAYREVTAVMGEKTTVGYERRDPRSEAYVPITINNPYRKEFLRVAGRSYNVFYYFTAVGKADGIISDDELTPLVFEKEVLIGAGRDFLIDLLSTKQNVKSPMPVTDGILRFDIGGEEKVNNKLKNQLTTK